MKYELKSKLVFIVIALFLCAAIAPGLNGASFKNELNSIQSGTGIIRTPRNNDNLFVNIQNIGDIIELTYNFDKFNIEEIPIDGEEYSRITLVNESNIMQKGCPDIPNIRRGIIIPDDAKMDVHISSSNYQDYENILIAPSKGILPRTIDPNDVPYVFGDVYDENNWFPRAIAELGDPYILRDFRGQVVIVNPFQYNPIIKKLRVYTEITVEVTPTGPGEKNVLYRPSSLSSIDINYKSIYENRFSNYNTERYTYVEEQGSMLVITYDGFWSAMLPFVEWKNMKGIPTVMVNLSDIGSTANDIDSYIENYYNTNGLTFVLLVGDIGQIPSFISGGNALDPTYGYISGSDSYPELFVGRFSASNTEDLQTQISRTIAYEKYPQAGAAWYHKGCGVGSPEGGPGQGDDDEADWEHIRNIRADLLSFTYSHVDEEYGLSQGGEDEPDCPTPEDISENINDGRSIVNYCGHGSSTTWGWNDPPHTAYTISAINSLENDNMLPYVICVACSNGVFNEMDECFCEAWMRATNDVTGNPTGAIVCTGTTKHGMTWAPPMAAQDEMVDLLCSETMLSVGGIHFNGCMLMNDEYGSTGEDETDHWHIFGDPSLQVRTDTPADMDIDYDSTVMNGATEFEVTVTGVEGALCAISSNGQLLGYAYTDATGNALITFNDPIEDMDELDLVVTAFNKMTYISTLDVLPPLHNIAEFEPMQGVLIAYPFGISYDIIAEMSEDVIVTTIVSSGSEQSYVESQYTANGVNTANCEYLIAPSDSKWTRDYGPWFRYNSTINTIEVIDFKYNRPLRPNDNNIPNVFASANGLTSAYMDINHTGGNYMTDGHGISISTELVLSENPSMTEEQIREMFSEYLGIGTYHLYPDPIGDYIDHVDCWGKFLSPDTIMIIEVSPSHDDYAEIEAAATYFGNQMSCYGANYNIERVYAHLSEPYINSLILNDKVLVPMTGSTYDADALQAYEDAMPGYEILGFTGSWLSTDALHCRAKGIPDIDMIQIDHDLLIDQMPNDAGFKVDADMQEYSSLKGVISPEVNWKNTSVGAWNTVAMTADGDTYTGFIPNHPCGETIYYYISAENSNGDIFNDPFIGADDPYSFDITLVPDIWVDPLSYSLPVGEGYTVSDNLTIGNDEFAGEQLYFNLSASDLSGLGWLSLNITQDSLQPGTSMNISVVANATGLSIGNYEESIILTSNDPDEPLITIPVDLTVVHANDVGAILVNSPSGIMPQGLHTVNATIENFGCMDQTDVLVNCTIYEGGIGGVVLEEDFSSVTPPSLPIGWTSTHSSNWATSASSNAGGVSPEARFYYSPSSTDTFRLYSDPIDTQGYTNLNISFKHFVNHYATPYDLHFEVSTDGSSWTPVWTISPTGNVGPETVNILLDYTNGVGSPTFYISFTFEGYSWNIDYWYIDDIDISAEIMGDISYTAETTVDISAYSTEYVEFTPPWDTQEIGIYGIKVQTLLPGDQDVSNDIETSAVEIFQDEAPPEISNIHDFPDPQSIDGFVNISCDVSDFTAVSSVFVDISGPGGFIPINISMAQGTGDNYYHYNIYSIEGNYTYRIWAIDTLGNGITTSDYRFRIISGDVIVVEIPVVIGWNLITVPVENSYTAMTLSENITGCASVSMWDNELQTYKRYIVGGPPDFDFPIEDGCGYFVDVDQNSTLTLSGAPVLGVNIPLRVGWNLVGWYHDDDTTAISLSENISGCSSVSMWDNELQTYQRYIVGGPPDFDFTITQGMGLFVDVTSDSNWYGEG